MWAVHEFPCIIRRQKKLITEEANNLGAGRKIDEGRDWAVEDR